jgi:hypothetical protein
MDMASPADDGRSGGFISGVLAKNDTANFAGSLQIFFLVVSN